MSKDDRDTLEVFKAELDFIEHGGYGRSVRTPWKPTSIFRDSLSCLNLGDPNQTHPCNECLLIDFVPPEARTQSQPCHHIPLNERGGNGRDLRAKRNPIGIGRIHQGLASQKNKSVRSRASRLNCPSGSRIEKARARGVLI
jgi:hypothetical protein